MLQHRVRNAPPTTLLLPRAEQAAMREAWPILGRSPLVVRPTPKWQRLGDRCPFDCDAAFFREHPRREHRIRPLDLAFNAPSPAFLEHALAALNVSVPTLYANPGSRPGGRRASWYVAVRHEDSGDLVGTYFLSRPDRDTDLTEAEASYLHRVISEAWL